MSIDDHIIHLENGVLHSDTPRSKVDQIVSSAIGATTTPAIVVHFHGGLVDYNSGRETAERLQPGYTTAGSYPVFFVWESGLLETIFNNLDEIKDEKIFRIIWKRVRKIVARKLAKELGARSGPGLPDDPEADVHDARIDAFLDTQELEPLLSEDIETPSQFTELTAAEMTMLEAEMAFDLELNVEVQKIGNGLRDQEDVVEDSLSRSGTVQGSTVTLMDPAALDRYIEGRSAQSRGLISTLKIIKAIIAVAGRVILRYLSGRDHGLHATIVEEILHEFYLANVGGVIWNTMKQDTADSFGNDVNAHGGSAFLDALKQQIDASNPPRIILVGHSTGAVYIAHFLEKANTMLPDGVVFEVIFLAPASTFRLTAKMLSDHQDRISGFRMFTMTDDFEKADRLVPVLYPHSLLYFVSGVVEVETDMPLVGMARYFDANEYKASKFPKVETVRQFMNQLSDPVVWSVTTGNDNGKNSSSEKHGDFTRDSNTMESVHHLIKQGF